MEPNLPKTLNDLLEANEATGTWTVLMTCGLAGSGKTTLAKAVEHRFPKYRRISMDEIVHEQHGLYGINYPASIDLYESYLAEADDQYMSRFHDLLLEKQNIIAERSFYAREDRNTFREMARGAGANVVLVFLEVTDKELLWQRICTRSQDPKTADSAFDIGRETFEMYWNGFEDPVDEEGALVVNVM